MHYIQEQKNDKNNNNSNQSQPSEITAGEILDFALYTLNNQRLMTKTTIVTKDCSRQDTQRIFRAVQLLCIILQCWIHVIINLSKSIEFAILGVNPNVNFLLRVIMCHYKFINCNTCTSLVRDVNNGEKRSCICGGREHIGNLHTFFSILL